MSVLLAAHGVDVVYENGFHALSGANVTVEDHESLALIGRSGSGKTTLLHVLAGLVGPSRGNVERHGTTSLVFQGANLLDHLTCVENVTYAASVAQADSNAEELLTLVGLEANLDALPDELSGGEAQRCAIARALAQQPEVLLCDEPTGHLDSDTATRVLDLIEALRAEVGFALVIATHDPAVAARCRRVLTLSDGRVVEEVAAA